MGLGRNNKQAAQRKSPDALSDSSRRRVATAALRGAHRWNEFIDYATNVDNLRARILLVVDRYGYGGINFRDLTKFMHRTDEQVAATLRELEEDGDIICKKRAGHMKYITPSHRNSPHPRILSDLYEGSDEV